MTTPQITLQEACGEARDDYTHKGVDSSPIFVSIRSTTGELLHDSWSTLGSVDQAELCGITVTQLTAFDR